MTTYKKLHGRAIKSVSTNLSDEGAEGQIWFNTTDNAFKSVVSSSAWVSSVPLPETSSNGGAAGTQTAGLYFGGRSSGAQRNTTSEYNGLGYSSGGAMGTGRCLLGGGGTQTAALASTGKVESPPSLPTQSEEYNGTSWTAGGSVTTARFALGGAGTQTANVIAGGRTPSWSTATEEYDGSSWTNGGALNQSKTLDAAMTGSLTATVAFGGDGYPPAAVNDVTFYDGTSWTETGNLPVANRNAGSAGPQTSAIFFGGKAPSETANAFLFDGTTFSTTGSMGSATYIMASAANASNNNTALSMGGYGGSAYISRTEEFTSSANVITAAAWASGGNYPSTAVAVSGTGTQNAAIGFGGYDPGGNLATSYLYDGSSWTSAPSLSEARQAMGSAIGAPQTSALAFGGYNTPGPPYARAVTDEWNGSSWTASGNMNTARDNSQGTGFGVQTAAIAAGGGGGLTSVESYNGSSWTALPAMPTGKKQGGSLGISTAGAVFGGFSPAPAVVATQLNYDGSSWTSGSSLNTARFGLGGAGTTTSGLAFKGNKSSPGGDTTETEQYNGTSWATAPATATAAYYTGAAGVNIPSSGALSISGRSTPAYLQTVEEFTAVTETLNVKTLTQS